MPPDASTISQVRPPSRSKRYLLPLLAGTYVLATFVPEPGRWFRAPLAAGLEATPVHILLGMLLFALGLSTPWARVGDLLQHGKWIGLSLLFRGTLFCAIALSIPVVPSQWSIGAAGFLLLLAMPSAASSSGWCLHIGSSQSVCLAMIAGTTLATTLTAPLLLRIGAALAPAEIAVVVADILAACELDFVLAWILGPMLLGMTLCSWAPAIGSQIQRLERPAAPIAFLLNYANASSSLPQLRVVTDATFVLGLFVGCIVLFITLAAITMWSTSRLNAGSPKRISTVLGTCMSNTGLALVLATVALPTDVTLHLAIIMYTFVQHLGVAILAPRWTRKMEP